MQMTWMGAPTIYYGDEAGLCGFTDPDNRRTYPWGREDQELIAFHKDIIRLRKEHDELRCGSIKQVAGDYNFLAYGRFHSKGQCLIAVNNDSKPVTKELRVWDLGIPKTGTMKTLLITDADGYRLEDREYEIKSGKIQIELPATCAVILKYADESKLNSDTE